MENYTRLHKPRDEGPAGESEVRVRSGEAPRFYVKLAIGLFRDKGHRVVVLKAMGKAINKTVAIAEVLKRRVAGLHQTTETSSMTLVDDYEPNEEGVAQGLNRIQAGGGRRAQSKEGRARRGAPAAAVEGWAPVPRPRLSAFKVAGMQALPYPAKLS
ncbi:Ribonuclease P protein subunit p25-like protein [Tetrabaena socialis]|uniref:Ribonuclease P protein subunit p25-like protein n=1 Tax=Tetrabaena socialis TaxID=47790 RepID=A0A2J7ZH42_9CHLO|nr:Ribonuclease P protein subunit p25-like protein [Tetrabaena socialis]|eukprot:PNG99593.1 Ribonuclease P protein subunit p25-like protein [Tetrabaena socialis]